MTEWTRHIKMLADFPRHQIPIFTLPSGVSHALLFWRVLLITNSFLCFYSAPLKNKNNLKIGTCLHASAVHRRTWSGKSDGSGSQWATADSREGCVTFLSSPLCIQAWPWICNSPKGLSVEEAFLRLPGIRWSRMIHPHSVAPGFPIGSCEQDLFNHFMMTVSLCLETSDGNQQNMGHALSSMATPHLLPLKCCPSVASSDI